MSLIVIVAIKLHQVSFFCKFSALSIDILQTCAKSSDKRVHNSSFLMLILILNSLNYAIKRKGISLNGT